MKTNQVLTRKMGEFTIKQRTSDSMFNANELLRQWNESTGMKKEMGDYFDNNSSKEFIQVIIEREDLHKGNSPYVKSRASRGENAGTWMHPLLFIDFAMWINPTFKYDVLKFVYDELIKHRNDAGDAYREMSAAIAKITTKQDLVVSISKVAEAVNYVAFNEHETAIRNRKAEAEMKVLVEIEKQVILLINVGFLKNIQSVIDYLRNEWKQRHVKTPQLFAHSLTTH